MDRGLYIVFILWISWNILSGQKDPLPFCGNEIHEKMLKLENPDFDQHTKYIEHLYQDHIVNNLNILNRMETVTIPVVFHVIHNNGDENISNEQILKGLEYLNESFANSGVFYAEKGINTQIEFCLAQRDEEGIETNGIIKHESIYTDMSLFEGYPYIRNLLWDPEKYFNIQLVRNVCLSTECNIAGFAGEGRIVVEATTVGTIKADATVLIHEVGHALGLRHTFFGGCKNDNCLEDGDRVCDTPPDNRTFEACFSASNSCYSDDDDISLDNPYRPVSLGGLGDQDDDHTNYMDYNIRLCRGHFTQGQSDRMHFFIQEKYLNLIESMSCMPPCDEEILVDFMLLDSVEVGTTLTIENLSENADSYEWSINRTTISTSNELIYTFNTQGIIEVTLMAYTDDPLCETKSMTKNIRVYCPVEACIDYKIKDHYVYFEDCSEDNSSVLWILISESNDTLYQSNESVDSFYVNNIEFVRLCMTVSNGVCPDVICEHITIINDGSEVCNNGVDDDGDGLIDLFDPDCPCDLDAYQAQCPTDCEVIPDEFPDIKMKLKWESEITGNSIAAPLVYTENDSAKVIIYEKEFTGENDFGIDIFNFKKIIINGQLGSTILKRDLPEYTGEMCMFRNSLTHLITEIYIGADSLNNVYKLYKDDGLISSSSQIDNTFGKLPVLTDINNDGIVEVILGTEIFNTENLVSLAKGNAGQGCNGNSIFNLCHFKNTVVADFLPSPGLELAAGNTVYDIELNNLNGEIGNLIIPIIADAPTFDGMTSYGDFDLDGWLDVVVLREESHPDGGGVTIWNPRTRDIMSKGRSYISGFVPKVCDLDNDCIPEIIIAYADDIVVYKYDEPNLIEWYEININDGTSCNLSTFDFNGDNYYEIVHRDEEFLKIFNGLNGNTIDSVQLFSITGFEHPVIADVDNDGQAEILISGYITTEEESRLYCFESATEPWAPARSVWNQYAYNPTMVNDDLTIPRYPQNPAQPLQGTENCPRETCSTPYNNFMVQATYRTQEGCYVWPEETCITEEVCNNGVDDDGDGLIDLFDPDCPCDLDAYQAQCPTDCEVIPDEFPDIKMKLKWESEITGNSIAAPLVYTENDSTKVIIYEKEFTGENEIGIDIFNYKKLIVSGQLGSTIFKRDLPEYTGEMCIFRNNLTNLITEIYIGADSVNNVLRIYKNDGIISSSSQIETRYGTALSLADVNNDGIVEVILGTEIFNTENLVSLAKGDAGQGCNGNSIINFCTRINTVVADFLPSSGLELAAGNTVYDIELNNLNGEIGNIMTPIIADAPTFDGMTSYGDFDLDGWLDVVVLRQESHPEGGGVTVWNPRTRNIMSKGRSYISGFVPKVCDLDNDCIPEIIISYVNKIIVYKYDEPNLIEWYEISINDGTSCNLNIFDFNNDGYYEIIHRDEEYLSVFNGLNGTTIDSIRLNSSTFLEHPVIADVDNDGQAEILISGWTTTEEESRLYCFESASTPWAPARSIWNQYAYNPTMVNDDLTIPRYPQNPAQPLQGTENCPRETCSTPYNNFMVQATYRTQEGCYVWPELQRDLSVTASSRCLGDSIEVCFYASSTDTTTIRNGVEISCYAPPWDNGSDSLIDVVTVTQDTTCIMMPMMAGIDSIMIVINDAGGYYPPDFPNTSITECDYTNNDFVLQLGGPDFSIDIVDWECSPDSLIFYIATDNVGLDTDVSCIGGGCYFIDPSGIGIDPQQYLLEVTNWCFDLDTTTMTYQYQDTFRVSIPHPMGQSTMYWTINEGGFGPGLLSSEITGIYECNYENNIDSISYDISTKSLDLGPDITKCKSEVFTLYAGAGFESYLWSDLSTDSIYSSSFEGLHYVEATDQCGRIYRDTVTILFDNGAVIDIGSDMALCDQRRDSITVLGTFDEVNWYPSEVVDCDTCRTVQLDIDTSIMLFAQGIIGNCVSFDSIMLSKIIPEIDTIIQHTCEGEMIDFYDQQVETSGYYEYLSEDCKQLTVLDARYYNADTMEVMQSICMGETYPFDGVDLEVAGDYQAIDTNRYGCDSLIMLSLAVVDQLVTQESTTICEGDSMMIFGKWQKDAQVYEEEFLSQAGCDSLHQITLEVEESYEVQETRTICRGDSTQINNEWYTSAGDYTLNLSSTTGCDSTIMITINELPTYDEEISRQICNGSNIEFNGEVLYATGTYIADLSSSSGCDSTVTLALEVVDAILDSLEYQICAGDTVEVFGEIVTSEGVYTEAYGSMEGCDSIVTITVAEQPIFTTTETYTLCPSDTITIHDVEITAGGNYEMAFTSIYGCDSTYLWSVEEIPLPAAPVMEVDCEEELIYMDLPTGTAEIWNIRWSNNTNGTSTDYGPFPGVEHVLLKTEDGCEVRYEFTLPMLPDFSTLPILPDTLTDQGNELTLSLPLNDQEWEVEWMTTLPQSCNTCMINSLTANKNSDVDIVLTHISTGCLYELSFTVEVINNKISVPNIFSPDGDGNNDIWTLYPPEGITIVEGYIYDRWGNLMTTLNAANAYQWDGRADGKSVATGVYVYLIKVTTSTGNNRIVKGDVTVVK